MDHVEKFKDYSVWAPIGCSVKLTFEKFESWLDDVNDHQIPYLKFALFFQVELSEERIDEFVSIVRDRFPNNAIEINSGVTECELSQIIEFCAEFNGEEEDV